MNSFFSNHFAILGNTGSGKSCGVARIVQNLLNNQYSLAYNANLIFFDSFGEYKNAFKSISSKAKIKVPKSRKKAYKKLLKSKGQKKSVKIS